MEKFILKYGLEKQGWLKKGIWVDQWKHNKGPRKGIFRTLKEQWEEIVSNAAAVLPKSTRRQQGSPSAPGSPNLAPLRSGEGALPVSTINYKNVGGGYKPSELLYYGAPREHRKGIHGGIDYYGKIGDPVYAYAPGTAYRRTQYDKNGKLSGGGHYIRIVHDDKKKFGDYADYMHLDKFIAGDGQRVNAGDLIGLVGNSGTTSGRKGLNSGAHLHFQISVNGKTVNPEPYIRRVLDALKGGTPVVAREPDVTPATATPPKRQKPAAAPSPPPPPKAAAKPKTPAPAPAMTSKMYPNGLGPKILAALASIKDKNIRDKEHRKLLNMTPEEAQSYLSKAKWYNDYKASIKENERVVAARQKTEKDKAMENLTLQDRLGILFYGKENWDPVKHKFRIQPAKRNISALVPLSDGSAQAAYMNSMRPALMITGGGAQQFYMNDGMGTLSLGSGTATDTYTPAGVDLFYTISGFNAADNTA